MSTPLLHQAFAFTPGKNLRPAACISTPHGGSGDLVSNLKIRIARVTMGSRGF